MNLKQYLEKLGDAKAAKKFGIKERTIRSWREGDRTPRPEHARLIVSLSPVTMKGIYGE